MKIRIVKYRYDYSKTKYKTNLAKNYSTGNDATEIDYRTEFEKIATIDDSLVPTVIRSSRGVLFEKDLNVPYDHSGDMRKKIGNR